VLETDAPDMTVFQHSGQRNSPEYVPYIADSLSKLTGKTIQEVALITTSNAKQILNL